MKDLTEMLRGLRARAFDSTVISNTKMDELIALSLQMDLDAEIMWDMLVEAYMDQLGEDEAKAHASVTFDFENRKEGY